MLDHVYWMGLDEDLNWDDEDQDEPG